MKDHAVYVGPDIGVVVNGRPVVKRWLVVERDTDLKTVRRQQVEGLDAAYSLADQWRKELGVMTPQQRSERIEALLHQMFEADKAYGSGFYSDPAWRAAYRELASLVDMNLE